MLVVTYLFHQSNTDLKVKSMVKGVTNTASAHSMEFEQAISQLFIADMCI